VFKGLVQSVAAGFYRWNVRKDAISEIVILNPDKTGMRSDFKIGMKTKVEIRVRNRWLAKFELTNYNTRMCNVILYTVL